MRLSAGSPSLLTFPDADKSPLSIRAKTPVPAAS